MNSVHLDPPTAQTLDKYSVLLRILRTYYTVDETNDDPEDGAIKLINEYRTQGESETKFSGLSEQVLLAAKNPVEASAAMNTSLGWTLTPNQVSDHMLALYDDLSVERQMEKIREDPNELMGYYTDKTFRLPFGWKAPYFGQDIPLWGIALAGGAFALIGFLGVTYLPFPVISQIAFAFLLIGAIAVFLSLVTMFFLRDEVVNADRYAERREALNRLKDAKQDKRRTSRINPLNR